MRSQWSLHLLLNYYCMEIPQRHRHKTATDGSMRLFPPCFLCNLTVLLYRKQLMTQRLVCPLQSGHFWINSLHQATWVIRLTWSYRISRQRHVTFVSRSQAVRIEPSPSENCSLVYPGSVLERERESV